jgi:hypothetical protein
VIFDRSLIPDSPNEIPKGFTVYHNNVATKRRIYDLHTACARHANDEINSVAFCEIDDEEVLPGKGFGWPPDVLTETDVWKQHIDENPSWASWMRKCLGQLDAMKKEFPNFKFGMANLPGARGLDRDPEDFPSQKQEFENRLFACNVKVGEDGERSILDASDCLWFSQYVHQSIVNNEARWEELIEADAWIADETRSSIPRGKSLIAVVSPFAHASTTLRVPTPLLHDHLAMCVAKYDHVCIWTKPKMWDEDSDRPWYDAFKRMM